MNFTKVGTWGEVCPSFGLLLGSSDCGKLAKKRRDQKTFVASAQRGTARSASRAARLPPVLSRSPSRSYPLAGERFKSRRRVLGRAVLASVVVRGEKKKLRRKKRSSVPSQSQPGEEKKRFHVRQVAFPQLSGFSLVPFGRIFAALRHPSSTAELRLSRSTKPSVERVKSVSETFPFPKSSTHALTHSLSHTPFRAFPPPPTPPCLSPSSGCCVSLALLCSAPPPVTRARGAEGEWEGKEGLGGGGGEGAAWRVTPTHHEPGTGPASLQHAASPWRRPQPLSAEVTSHPSAASSAARLSSKCQFASVRGMRI